MWTTPISSLGGYPCYITCPVIPSTPIIETLLSHKLWPSFVLKTQQTIMAHHGLEYKLSISSILNTSYIPNMPFSFTPVLVNMPFFGMPKQLLLWKKSAQLLLTYSRPWVVVILCHVLSITCYALFRQVLSYGNLLMYLFLIMDHLLLPCL